MQTLDALELQSGQEGSALGAVEVLLHLAKTGLIIRKRTGKLCHQDHWKRMKLAVFAVTHCERMKTCPIVVMVVDATSIQIVC